MDTLLLSYLNALNYTSLGPKKLFVLLKLFGNDPQRLWNASALQLKQNNLSGKSLENFLSLFFISGSNYLLPQNIFIG